MPKTTELSLAPTADASADYSAGSIFFVGTTTVILRYAGFTILTDPNFLHAGDHAHLGYGLTAQRLTEPALDIEDLPPLDFCVLSHYYGDHFDQVAEEKLQKDLPIVTTQHAASELEDKGFTATIALDTWDSAVVDKGDARVRVTSTPAKHGPLSSKASSPRSWAACWSSSPRRTGRRSASTSPGIRTYSTIYRRSRNGTRRSTWHSSTLGARRSWGCCSRWTTDRGSKRSGSSTRARSSRSTTTTTRCSNPHSRTSSKPSRLRVSRNELAT